MTPFAAVLLILGIALLAYAAWARAGRSPTARRWLSDNSLTDDTNFDLMTIYVAPAWGVVLCVWSVIVYLDKTDPPNLIGVIVLLVLIIPTVAVRLQFRVPDAIYPRWARELRVERRARRG